MSGGTVRVGRPIIEYDDVANFNRVIKIDRSAGFPELSYLWLNIESLEKSIDELKSRYTFIRIPRDELYVDSSFCFRNGAEASTLVIRKLLQRLTDLGSALDVQVFRDKQINYNIYNSIVSRYYKLIRPPAFILDTKLNIVVDLFDYTIRKLPIERVLAYMMAVRDRKLAEVLWAGIYRDIAYTCVYAEDCSWLCFAHLYLPKYTMRRHFGRMDLDGIDKLPMVAYTLGHLFPVFAFPKEDLSDFPKSAELILRRLIRNRMKHKGKKRQKETIDD